MSRDLHSNFTTELATNNIKPILAAKFEFATVTIRLWTGYGDITINSEIYKGIGTLGSLGNVEETAQTKAVSQDFILSGIPSKYIHLALIDNYSGRDATLFFGLLDESDAVISNVVTLFKGIIDVITVTESGETSTIRLRAESRLVQLERSIERRYTSQQQKLDFSGDLGLDLIEELIDRDIVWETPTS
tara:strand:+ start:3596 stop:4162 length:567 start_codon:yes stop_codon:yes gene_type:complete